MDRNLSFRFLIKSYGWSSATTNGEIKAQKKDTDLLAPISMRKSTSDLDVFRQTFIGHSYQALLDYAKKHNAGFLKKKGAFQIVAQAA